MKKKSYYFSRLLTAGIVSATLIAGSSAANGQTRGQRANQLAVGAVISGTTGFAKVRAGGKSIVFRNGLFYRRLKGSYTLIDAPIGAVVERLPRRSVAFQIGRTRYHIYGGVYYLKVKRGYQVVVPPMRHTYNRIWFSLPLFGMQGFFVPSSGGYAWSARHRAYRIADGFHQNSDVQGGYAKGTGAYGSLRNDEYVVDLSAPRGRTVGRSGREADGWRSRPRQ